MLSVEDDNAAYALIRIGFEEVGGDFRLCRARDGSEALDFLRRAGPFTDAPRPDLVLLDLNLPLTGVSFGLRLGRIE